MSTVSALDMRLEVCRLVAERLDALEVGIPTDAAAMSDLEDDLNAAREAYVGLAVTEIASLRGQLFGREVG